MSTNANWNTVKIKMPERVQEIYPTVWDGHIIVAGGLCEDGNGSFDDTNKSWSFDPATTEWTPIEVDLPYKCHHAHLAVAGEYLYLVGGFSVSQSRQWMMRKECWRRTRHGKWEEIEPLPQPQAEGILFSHNGRLHMFGGRSPKDTAKNNGDYDDHKDVKDHWIYEPGTNKWKAARDAPDWLVARNSTAAIKIDGKVYNFGGRDSKLINSTEVDIYDIDTDRWGKLNEGWPQGQSGIAAGVIDAKIVVFGGEDYSKGQVSGDVWIFDPKAESNPWRPGPKMNVPRHGLGGVTIDNVIYALGGAKIAGPNQTTSTVETLTIA